jgi:hypothetical protein
MTHDECKATFEKYDLNKDGAIDEAELYHFVQDLYFRVRSFIRSFARFVIVFCLAILLCLLLFCGCFPLPPLPSTLMDEENN